MFPINKENTQGCNKYVVEKKNPYLHKPFLWECCQCDKLEPQSSELHPQGRPHSQAFTSTERSLNTAGLHPP